jgi:hypothetical protein
MNTIPTLDDELKALGALMGLPGLAWDEEGACTLEIGDRLALTMYVDADRRALILYTVIGRLRENASSSELIDLLSANFFWKDTAGATIGIERGSMLVFMVQSLPIDALTINKWDETLRFFIPSAKDWIEKLSSPGESQPAEYVSPMQISSMMRV